MKKNFMNFPSEWFINENEKFEGQLIVDYDRGEINLEIYGNKYLEGSIILPNARTTPSRFHKVIWSTSITLYNCSWNGTERIGKTLYKITYKIEYKISHPYSNKLQSNFKVLAGTFVYHNLSYWFDGTETLDKLKGKQGLYVNGEHVVQNMLTVDSIEINDNLTIVLYDKVYEDILDIGKSFKTVYQKFLCFKYKNEVTFEEMLSDAVVMKKFLSFTHNDIVKHKIHSIVVNDDKHKHKTNYTGTLLDVTNFTIHGNKEIKDQVGGGYWMWLSRWNCSKEELGTILKVWFENKQYHTIYEYYIDSNNWYKDSDARISNVMFNNRFLNLVQALEDFQRRYFGKVKPNTDDDFNQKKTKVITLIEDDELKKWLNIVLNPRQHSTLRTKLESILEIDEVHELLKSVTLSDFIKKVKKYRDILSHGSANSINQGEELMLYYHISKLILCICIIKSLRVENIVFKIKDVLHYQDAIREIQYRQQHAD